MIIDELVAQNTDKKLVDSCVLNLLNECVLARVPSSPLVKNVVCGMVCLKSDKKVLYSCNVQVRIEVASKSIACISCESVC